VASNRRCCSAASWVRCAVMSLSLWTLPGRSEEQWPHSYRVQVRVTHHEAQADGSAGKAAHVVTGSPGDHSFHLIAPELDAVAQSKAGGTDGPEHPGFPPWRCRRRTRTLNGPPPTPERCLPQWLAPPPPPLSPAPAAPLCLFRTGDLRLRRLATMDPVSVTILRTRTDKLHGFNTRYVTNTA
jgi:hypothetical protein